jgi:hypothetical protein
MAEAYSGIIGYGTHDYWHKNNIRNETKYPNLLQKKVFLIAKIFTPVTINLMM